MIHRYLTLSLPAAAVATVALAAALPYGALLAPLACVPILLASDSDSRGQVLATGGAAMLAAAGVAGATALLGAGGSVSAAGTAAWPLAALALVLATGLAFWLQQRRREALSGRDAAEASSEMNRLLMSLLAHDLRAPLSLADQGFQYVEESIAGGYPVDRMLVADVRARLQRSLRAIEMVLSIASTGSDAGSRTGNAHPLADLHEEIGAEILAFRYEAEARGKQLAGELDAVRHTRCRVDTLVLRQALAIVLDNAIRYADPGVIRVHASVVGSTLEMRVSDPGPGLSTHRSDPGRAGGSGLGLQLCGTLLARAGGSLRTERDAPDGTTLLIRIPVSVAPPVPAAAPAAPAAALSVA